MLGYVLIIILLIFINSLYASAEIAFFEIDKYDLNNMIKHNNKRAKRISKMLSDTSSFLSTIQVVATLTGFLASALTANVIVKYITITYPTTIMSVTTYGSLILVVATIILTYLTLVFGEIIPKKLAMIYPYKIALDIVNIVYVSNIILKPFVRILAGSCNLIFNIFRVKDNNHVVTENDVKKAIMNARSSGNIENFEKDLLLKVCVFNDTSASKIMTRFEDAVCFNDDDKIDYVVKTARKYKLTRFPVLNIDNNVCGIINIKDLIINEDSNCSIRDLMREPLFINTDEKLDKVFLKMRDKQQALAIVKNSDNHNVGILTNEDIIEVIVGNIYDEYDYKI